MTKIKQYLLALVICQFSFSQNDTLKNKTTKIDEVKIVTETNLKLKQENNKYEVSVAGTSFQNTLNTWEGLKQIPMLRVNEGDGLKVNNKTAIVEINGLQSLMSGVDLENYLKSLDPKTIKKIQINSNPNASYGSEVNAVVNIILSQKQGSYRVGINTTNGVRTNYFNNSNGNYALNRKNTRLYTTYSFDYLPIRNTSEINSQIGNQLPLIVNYKENDKQKNHQSYINFNFDIGKKNQIDLTSILNFSKNNKIGKSNNATFNRDISLNSKNRTLQFAQVWKHSVNDSVTLKIGSYQVYKNANSQNNALTNNSFPEYQLIKTRIPIFIGFLDYSNKNKLGLSETGIRFNAINVNNENNSIINLANNNSPFQYQEKVLALYFNHSFDISETKSLAFGIRSESSFINYNFNNSLSNLTFSNSIKYTNLLYNINYNWQTKNERNFSLSFRKQIQRPNYSSLNPFRSINSDVIYFSGDSQINPSKLYTLTFETSKNDWSYYLQSGLFDDYISTFTEVKDNLITETYKNFKTILFTGFGVEYNKEFFKKKWVTKVSLDFTYFKINDSNYTFVNSTPSANFTTINSIDLGNKFKLNVNYIFSNTYKDGLVKHYERQRLDLTLSKKLNSNFQILISANDIFKSNYAWEETTIPNYFYGSRYYEDIRSIALTIKWNITGKSYKVREIEKPDGDPIERL